MGDPRDKKDTLSSLPSDAIEALEAASGAPTRPETEPSDTEEVTGLRKLVEGAAKAQAKTEEVQPEESPLQRVVKALSELPLFTGVPSQALEHILAQGYRLISLPGGDEKKCSLVKVAK